MAFAALAQLAGTGATAAGTGTAAAGTATGIGAALMGNPILKALFVNFGAQAATELLGSIFGTESPAEKYAQQYTEAGTRLLPQLEAQARGEPTAATEAQFRQLGQATTRMQQSYGASARAGGLGAPTLGGGQPTVSRAQMGRYQAAQLGAMGDIMGRSQIAAQAQLGGLAQAGMGVQRQLEAEDLAARGQSISNITAMINEYQQQKARGEQDARMDAFYERFLAIMEAMLDEDRQ